MNVTTRQVNVRGIETTVHRGGAGEPLLYLHSASAEATVWGEAFDRLAQRCDVIVPIHPGFPGSDGLDRVRTVGDLVLHVVDLLNALGIRTAHVVGSSLGGWIAAELASLYPERVGGLVLVGAAGLWIEGWTASAPPPSCCGAARTSSFRAPMPSATGTAFAGRPC